MNLLLLAASAAWVQSTQAAPISTDPIARFVGVWEGNLEIQSPNQAKTTVVKVQMAYGKTSTPDVYMYKLVYDSQPPRNYLLKPVDKKAGIWKVDEQNGVVLQSYLVGDTLINSFSVGNNLISTTTQREQQFLNWTLISLEINPQKSDVGMKDAVSAVVSHKVLSIQRAKLRLKT